MALLEATGLGKRYAGRWVLRGVDMAVEAGEVVAVLGVNGAGKTTLLGCLAGMLGWTSGEVRLGGRRLDRSDLEQRRRLGFWPSEGLFFPECDVIRNAAVFRELWRGEAGSPPLDLEEWIERLDLLDVAFSPLGTLSRGQAYKASLLALLCADPQVWLVDEPFAAGMDARGMEAFRQMARGAADRCVVYTTQFPELAGRFADRVVVLGSGGIVMDEPTAGVDPEELSVRVAGWLGIKPVQRS